MIDLQRLHLLYKVRGIALDLYLVAYQDLLFFSLATTAFTLPK